MSERAQDKAGSRLIRRRAIQLLLTAGLPILTLFASGSVFGSPLLYPQGNQFCFTFYSTKINDSSDVLTNGATALGPYYGDQSAPLAQSIGFNTEYIYKISPPSMAGGNATTFDNGTFVWPSDATITNQVAAIVIAARTNANIAMWDFEPEELRPWKPMELHYFQIVSAAIRANDPTNRPLYNYQPNNRDTAILSTILPYEDICAKGMYVSTITDSLGKSCLTNRIWARWSMEQEVGAVAASNTNAIPWIVLWMAADPPVGMASKITEWCRHDAYMGLIMGGKGIEIFSGFQGRSGFSDTNFYAYLNGYLSVAHDLNGPLNLAPVFLFGSKQSNVTMAVTSGPANLQLAYDSVVNNYPPIAYLATTYAGTNYLFMVNSAEESVTATFSGVPSQNRADLFAGVNNATPGGSFSVTLSAHGVKAFQFLAPAPPIITRAGITNGFFAVGGTGTSGWNYVLQSTTNLTPPVSWMSVATNSTGTNIFDFTNLQTGGFPWQLYRVFLQ